MKIINLILSFLHSVLEFIEQSTSKFQLALGKSNRELQVKQFVNATRHKAWRKILGNLLSGLLGWIESNFSKKFDLLRETWKRISKTTCHWTFVYISHGKDENPHPSSVKLVRKYKEEEKKKVERKTLELSLLNASFPSLAISSPFLSSWLSQLRPLLPTSTIPLNCHVCRAMCTRAWPSIYAQSSRSKRCLSHYRGSPVPRQGESYEPGEDEGRKLSERERETESLATLLDFFRLFAYL